MIRTVLLIMPILLLFASGCQDRTQSMKTPVSVQKLDPQVIHYISPMEMTRIKEPFNLRGKRYSTQPTMLRQEVRSICVKVSIIRKSKSPEAAIPPVIRPCLPAIRKRMSSLMEKASLFEASKD